jgi:glycosyltransferase involved in cell wall biosynthesis
MNPVDEGQGRRIAIVLDDFAGLAGATDFLLSIIDGLMLARPDWSFLFVYRRDPPRYGKTGLRGIVRALGKTILRRQAFALPPRSDPARVIARLRRDGMPDTPVETIPHSDAALLRLCAARRIDAVLPFAAALPAGFAVPWVGYLYDFQHRAYPELFTASERAWRDTSFRTMVDRAPAVIVNARQVLADAKQYLGPMRGRIFALPFSAAPASTWFDSDPQEVRLRYGIGPRYFIISNQFWVHKRHDVALQALAMLADETVELVTTGATHDARAPGHFAALRALVEELGLAKRIHFLGLIPKLDQIALLRGAVAVVQPTSFEGGPGGGSVFDAVALGLPTIVSDIAVNREIEEHVTRYVPLGDAPALAQAMAAALADDPPRPKSRQRLMDDGQARRKAMGEVVAQAVDHAIDRNCV